MSGGVSLAADTIVRAPEGLCSARFHADIVTHGVDYASLRVGDVLNVDGRTIRITRVGKHCHDACPLAQRGESCMLKTHCAFGEWTDAEK